MTFYDYRPLKIPIYPTEEYVFSNSGIGLQWFWDQLGISAPLSRLELESYELYIQDHFYYDCGPPYNFQDVAEQPRDFQDVVEQPWDFQDVVEQPRDFQDVVEQPRDFQDVVEQPRDCQDVVEQPWDFQDVVEQPRDCQDVVEQPRDFQDVVKQPRDFQDVVEQHRDFQEVVEQPRDFQDVVGECSVDNLESLVLDHAGIVGAKLSLYQMLELRVLSKAWCAMVGEQFALTKHAPWYCWPFARGFVAYIPERNEWRMWQPRAAALSYIVGDSRGVLGSEPPQRYQDKDSSRKRRKTRGENSSSHVCGGAKELLLVERCVNSERELSLINAVTCSSSVLPQDVLDNWVMGMRFDKFSGSYIIFGKKYGPYPAHYYAFGSMALPNSLHKYDLNVKSWKNIGELGSGRMHLELPTLYGGALHCLVTNGRANYTVFRFDNRRKTWDPLQPEIPQGLHFVHLFEWRGNLMVVGGKVSNCGLSSIQIWLLDEEKEAWMETMTMPDDLLNLPGEVQNRLDLKYKCVSGGDYVCVFSYGKELTVVQHVMCVLSETSWKQVPEPTFNVKLRLMKGSDPFMLNC